MGVLARLDGEMSNTLFETLDDWNAYLAKEKIDLRGASAMRFGASNSPRSLRDNFKNSAGDAKRRPKPGPRLTLRLTDDEIQRLRSAACNMSLSGYVRKRLFAGNIVARKASAWRPVADQHALARLSGC